MKELEALIFNVYPELKIKSPSLPNSGEITLDELNDSLKNIKKFNLVQDAKHLLLEENNFRRTINYELKYASECRDLFFKVEYLNEPDLLIGHIIANENGNIKTLARFYGMSVE